MDDISGENPRGISKFYCLNFLNDITGQGSANYECKIARVRKSGAGKKNAKMQSSDSDVVVVKVNKRVPINANEKG